MARKISKAQQKQIVRASRKAASRAGANHKAAAGKLRVQTVALWKRIVIGGFGLLLLGFATSIRSHSIGTAIFLFIAAALMILLGVFGKRKTIDAALNGLDSALLDKIWDGIL